MVRGRRLMVSGGKCGWRIVHGSLGDSGYSQTFEVPLQFHSQDDYPPQKSEFRIYAWMIFYEIVPLLKTNPPKGPGKIGGPLGKFVCISGIPWSASSILSRELSASNLVSGIAHNFLVILSDNFRWLPKKRPVLRSRLATADHHVFAMTEDRKF
jgi:hypothetical protein